MMNDPGPSQYENRRNAEKGNVFFIIFIGIALFATLSYAVANMLREGNPDVITREKAGLNADEILDYARTIRQAAQTLRINGCADTEISFSMAAGDAYEHSPDVRDECKIFHPSGGGITPQAQGPGGASWFFQGGTQVFNVGSNGAAADNGELMIYIQVGSDMICDYLNRKMNVAEDIDAGTFPQTTPLQPKFKGAYDAAGVIGDTVAPGANGQLAACLDYSGAMTPPPESLFYQVLVAR